MFFQIQNIVISSKRVLLSYNLQTVYFRINTKYLLKELLQKPTLILLIFYDFRKIFDFWPNLGFSEVHFWIFRIVGNRQTQKQTFFLSGIKMQLSLTTHQNDKGMRFFQLIRHCFLDQKAVHLSVEKLVPLRCKLVLPILFIIIFVAF